MGLVAAAAATGDPPRHTPYIGVSTSTPCVDENVPTSVVGDLSKEHVVDSLGNIPSFRRGDTPLGRNTGKSNVEGKHVVLRGVSYSLTKVVADG